MNDSWNPGKQFAVAKITPAMLWAWEAAARAKSHQLRPGEYNWPMMVRSLIAALKEKTGDSNQ